MSDVEIGSILAEYNRIIKENDEVYRKAVSKLGLSGCTFWILYSLRAEDHPLTQKELCDLLYQPKQTVNSALKKLEGEGCLRLEPIPGRRSKTVTLTEKGRELARCSADRVLALERQSLEDLTPEEQAVFIDLYRKFTVRLRARMAALRNIKEPI